MRAALFDFDGTLADSFPAIAASTNHARAAYGLPPLPEGRVRRYVGHGLDHLMAALVPAAPVADAVAVYRRHHEAVMESGTRLMPGVADTILELARRGYRLGVCSNKRVEFTRRLVDALGLGPHFGCVLGPDDVGGRAKPDPAMLLEGLSRLGATAADAVYVGDMDIDVRTGAAAGVPVWLVPGGAGAWDEAVAAGPARVLADFAELLDLLPPR
ncbi:MAG: phosphoglycolate phosphatase [Isosphaera sp.]|nr:phosphoglycolate phosphatase [Isosphaera sp.]